MVPRLWYRVLATLILISLFASLAPLATAAPSGMAIPADPHPRT